jgi:heme/copper-type cytochrome/quinol oxidase subunit 1
MRIGLKILLGAAYLACLADLYFASRAAHGVILVLFVLTGAVCGLFDRGK